MRHYEYYFLVISLLMLGGIGCSSEPGGDTKSEEGVPVVTTNPSPRHDGPLFTLKSDLVLGIDDGEPEWQLFSRLVFPLIATDGRMYIADYGRNEIFIINVDGTLHSRVGRKGSGPGEFRWIAGLFWMWRGQEFWVQDRSLNRFSCFSANGEFLRTQDIGQIQTRYDWFIGLNGRQFLGLAGGSMQDGSNSSYTFISEDLEVIKEFIEVPPQQMWHDKKRGGWGMIYYAEMDGVAVFPDGRILSYHPYLPRISVYSPDGDPILHLDHHWVFPEVTEEEKDHVRSLFLDNPGNANFRHWATDMPLPDTHAAFNLVLPDDQGRIWVRRTGTKRRLSNILEHVFDLFDTNGVWLGTQQLPYEPVAIERDYVYFIFVAESGAPRFGRFELVPVD